MAREWLSVSRVTVYHGRYLADALDRQKDPAKVAWRGLPGG